MQPAYIVVPFERVGTMVGPKQAMMVDAVNKARYLAQNLALKVPGVAVLERTKDPETGDDVDTLLEGYGILPPTFPDGINWTVALN